jgi:16S rRNA (guanine966-N2)-methyltransferase
VSRSRRAGGPGGLNRLRIIGGRWRGRRFSFPPAADLRPTPDRVRETVFNWLAPWIEGARCLDLYAGSGALGMEALSRGAARVVFVDRGADAVRRLRANLAELEADDAEVVHTDAEAFLRHGVGQFDIVFLDPPFRQGLVVPCCALLAQRGWLSADAFVYVEAEQELDVQQLQGTWEIHRSKRAGRIGYHLLRRRTDDGRGARTL